MVSVSLLPGSLTRRKAAKLTHRRLLERGAVRDFPAKAAPDSKVTPPLLRFSSESVANHPASIVTNGYALQVHLS
jgi:hypothetical protein